LNLKKMEGNIDKQGNYSATDKKSMFFQQTAAILRIIAALH
jgi:hypothetical protein